MPAWSNYLLGRVDKAVIYVPNPEGLRVYEHLANDQNKTEYIGSMQKKQEDIIRKAGKEKLKLSAIPGSDVGIAALDASVRAQVAAANVYRSVTVQYNPKTLQFRGLGGASRSYTSGLGQMSENGINQINNKTSTTLSCELVFTNVNISDAFMTEDLYNMNIENAMSLGTSIGKRIAGKSPSVQPQVDGMLSLLMNEYTRFIIFAWAGTVFRGELTRVDANYKMFNKRGDPIVATINIDIRQGFNANQNFEEEYWRKAVEKVFISPN